MKNQILIMLFLGFIIFSCEEEPIGQIPLDNVPPGPVSNVQVENISGGAILTYTLPEDEDLLYVKGVYSLKEGMESEVKSSLYTDTLKIRGFGDTSPREVRLYAVDRSKNTSESVTVTVEPLTPPVLKIGETLKLVADFGGVAAYWENPERAEISVAILKKDENDEYVPLETFYSSMKEGTGAARGMDTLQGYFGIYVQDRWENQSEIKYDTLTPLFETQFDRLKFSNAHLPGDMPSAWGWVEQNLWDGNPNSGFHTANGSGVWPQSITIDLGQTGKISRVKVWQRPDTWLYQHGNVKHFEVWGAAELDASGSWDSWTMLMDCQGIKPSGLPLGEFSAEDQAWAMAGEEFINSPENPPVRYIRLKVLETWSGGDFFHMMEIEVYGDNRY